MVADKTKVSINDIFRNSPALPASDSKGHLKDSEKDNLFQASVINKKAVLKGTMMKMIYCDDFWQEANYNGFFEDYTDRQNYRNSRYLSKKTG